MKVEKLEKFDNKMGLKGFKWSSLNAPSTQSCHSHSILDFLAFWSNKNWKYWIGEGGFAKGGNDFPLMSAADWDGEEEERCRRRMNQVEV